MAHANVWYRPQISVTTGERRPTVVELRGEIHRVAAAEPIKPTGTLPDAVL
jgi:hypothetical protein